MALSDLTSNVKGVGTQLGVQQIIGWLAQLQGMAAQDPSSVAITGGAMDNVVIGGSKPLTGTFTVIKSSNGTFGAGPLAGYGWFYGSGTYGAAITGNGSVYDIVIANNNGKDVIEIPTGTNTAQFRGTILSYAFGANNALFLQRAQGTSGTPTALTSGDTMLEIGANGYDGGTYLEVARILATASQTFTSGSGGGYFDFQTRSGTGALTSTMQIRETQHVLIGTSTDDGVNLAQINGTLSVHGTPSGVASKLSIGDATQTTVGANGAASALTANPLGYLIAYLGTTKIAIPYYNG